MKSLVLSLAAVFLVAGVSFGQDCSSGTCSRPAKKVVEAVASPVKAVAAHKPARSLWGRVSSRRCKLLRCR